MFMKHGLQSERDLIGSMEFLAKIKEISFQALEEAKETMRKNVLSFAIKESTSGGLERQLYIFYSEKRSFLSFFHRK